VKAMSTLRLPKKTGSRLPQKRHFLCRAKTYIFVPFDFYDRNS
jgi:hypothetical protein